MSKSSSIALVVDDEESVRDLVAAILEEEGFIVMTAASGEEALALFEDQVFDIVFTDIQMDGMSGFELMEKIHELDTTVKIIVMTGYSSYDAVLQSLKKGAHDYLEKPLEDHTRIATAALKAYEYVTLARDNELLLAKLKASHSRLAAANNRLIELNKQLKNLAVTDSLTGLYNRRFLTLALNRELDKYSRSKQPFSLIKIDVDNFRHFNETHGDDAGGKVLTAVASLISGSSRSFDIVSRFGADEFIVLLAQTKVSEAVDIAERLCYGVSEISFAEGGASLSVSIGVTGLDGIEAAPEATTVLTNLERALSKAKHSGGGRVFRHPQEIPLQSKVANG